jgi:hypothetical protein
VVEVVEVTDIPLQILQRQLVKLVVLPEATVKVQRMFPLHLLRPLNQMLQVFFGMQLKVGRCTEVHLKRDPEVVVLAEPVEMFPPTEFLEQVELEKHFQFQVTLLLTPEEEAVQPPIQRLVDWVEQVEVEQVLAQELQEPQEPQTRVVVAVVMEEVVDLA